MYTKWMFDKFFICQALLARAHTIYYTSSGTYSRWLWSFEMPSARAILHFVQPALETVLCWSYIHSVHHQPWKFIPAFLDFSLLQVHEILFMNLIACRRRRPHHTPGNFVNTSSCCKTKRVDFKCSAPTNGGLDNKSFTAHIPHQGPV